MKKLFTLLVLTLSFAGTAKAQGVFNVDSMIAVNAEIRRISDSVAAAQKAYDDTAKVQFSTTVGSIGHIANAVDDPGILAALSKAVGNDTVLSHVKTVTVFRRLIIPVYMRLGDIVEKYGAAENKDLEGDLAALFGDKDLYDKVVALKGQYGQEILRRKKSGLSKLSYIYKLNAMQN